MYILGWHGSNLIKRASSPILPQTTAKWQKHYKRDTRLNFKKVGTLHYRSKIQVCYSLTYACPVNTFYWMRIFQFFSGSFQNKVWWWWLLFCRSGRLQQPISPRIHWTTDTVVFKRKLKTERCRQQAFDHRQLAVYNRPWPIPYSGDL